MGLHMGNLLFPTDDAALDHQIGNYVQEYKWGICCFLLTMLHLIIKLVIMCKNTGKRHLPKMGTIWGICCFLLTMLHLIIKLVIMCKNTGKRHLTKKRC
jgi:hypothetical protein